MASIFLLAACDKIEAPYTKNDNPAPTPGDTSGNDTSTFLKIKKVLLEEFTGHLCVNCPAAHELAKELAVEHNGKLSIISIHAGYQAVTEGDFPEDFTCTEGDDIFAAYNNPFNPMGLVNRNSEAAYQSSEWAEKIAGEMALAPEFAIILTPNYNASSKKLDVTMKMKSWVTYTGNLRYAVLITESDIIAPQKNGDATVGETPVIEDYHHMHVLRGSMNGTWGDLLGDSFEVDQELSKSLSLTLDDSWDAENCEIVAFIFDEDTKRILQVEEINVTE